MITAAMRLALMTTCAALVPLGVGAQAKEPGDLWEVQTTMSMEGMPMAMPAQTQRVCVPRSDNRPPVGDGDKDCEMYEVKRSGSTHAWKMRCAGPPPTQGSGQMTYQGRDAYQGTMTIETQGEKMTMKLAGRRLGDCDYAQTRAQQSAQIAQMKEQQAKGADAVRELCARTLETMDAEMVKSSTSTCGDQRSAYCARARAADGYPMVARQPLAKRQEAAKYCGLDLAATRSALCKRAEQQEDVAFLAAQCVVRPDDQPAAPLFGLALFKRECAGRSFTGVNVVEKYRTFCNAAVASGIGREAGRPVQTGAKAADPSAATPTPAPTPTPKPAEDAIKKGTDLLRGIFGR
jgi:hypothetical protein